MRNHKTWQKNTGEFCEQDEVVKYRISLPDVQSDGRVIVNQVHGVLWPVYEKLWEENKNLLARIKQLEEEKLELLARLDENTQMEENGEDEENSDETNDSDVETNNSDSDSDMETNNSDSNSDEIEFNENVWPPDDLTFGLEVSNNCENEVVNMIDDRASKVNLNFFF